MSFTSPPLGTPPVRARAYSSPSGAVPFMTVVPVTAPVVVTPNPSLRLPSSPPVAARDALALPKAKSVTLVVPAERGLTREDSLMEDVRVRIGMLQDPMFRSPSVTPSVATSRAAIAASIKAATVSDELETRISEQKCLVSVRVAVVGVIIGVAILTAFAMYFPLYQALYWILKRAQEAAEEVTGLQSHLISDLIDNSVAQQAYCSLLESMKAMVEQFVKQPASHAVDGMKSFITNLHAFDLSWDGRASRQRQALAYQAWLQLVTLYNTTALGPSQELEHRGQPGVFAIYAAFSSGEVAGAMRDCGPPFGCMLDSSGGQDATLDFLAAEPPSPVGSQLVNRTPYLATSRPYFEVQRAFQERALQQPGRPAGASGPQLLWSRIYTFATGQPGISLTAPVSFCGDYSCFTGVLAADKMLASVSADCTAEWRRIKTLLSDSFYSYSIGPENSSVFIVAHQADLFPDQEGLLVAASHFNVKEEPGHVQAVQMATAAKSMVVSTTARALLRGFGSWRNASLESHQFLTFRLSGATAAVPDFSPCQPAEHHEHHVLEAPYWEEKEQRRLRGAPAGSPADCLQVGTSSFQLDPYTRWLIAVVLPADAFRRKADETTAMVANEVQALRQKNEQKITNANVVCFVFFATLLALSLVLACFLGLLVTRPLKRLNQLMRRLADLDFAKEPGDFSKIRLGTRARIREVADLQQVFVRLSRGIEAFARFVPETVVRGIVRGELKATRPHVIRREVTIMFSDIKSFTTIAENLQHRDLLYLLTRYNSVMTRIIEHYEGIVAEILGDGLLNFWNTPDDVEDHAAKACAAALAQQQALGPLNEEFERMKIPTPAISIRIGIHTGEVLSGNFGSELKMKFGCMGDPVNLASRLEGLCKYYGVSIICSGCTYERLPAKAGFFCRELDLVCVKGKREFTRVYELIGIDFRHASASLSRSKAQEASSISASWRAFPLKLTTAVVHEAMQSSSEALHAATTSIWAPIRRWMGRRRQVPLGVDAKTAAALDTSEASQYFDPAWWRSAVMGDDGVDEDEEDDVTEAESTSSNDSSEDESEEQKEAYRGPSGEASRDVITFEQRRHAHRYEEALQAFQAARFQQARDLAKALTEEFPYDSAAQQLLQRADGILGKDGRVQGLSAEDLANWTGVNYMMEK